MKTLVIYDSVFGNTEKIALAMAQSFGPENETESWRVQDVTPGNLENVKVLLVGSPTRQFRATPEITNFLNGLPDGSLIGVKVAAFDTRLTLSVIKSRIFRFIVDKGGYAAKFISLQLEKKGGQLMCPPEGFFVSGENGPLESGEEERAALWAASLH